MDDSKVYVVCSPIGKRSVSDFIEGSVERKCCECGTPVMISPATLKTQEEKGANIVCIPCAAPSMNSKGNSIATSKIQHEELVNEFKKAGYADNQISAILEDFYKKHGRLEL